MKFDARFSLFANLKALFGLAAAMAVAIPGSAFAQEDERAQAGALHPPGYVDLIDLSQSAEFVALVMIEEQITVPLERAPGLQPGKVRLYLEATTLSLLSGRSAIGASLAYLVDLPLTAEGDAPELAEQTMLIFARSTPGRSAQVPAQIQLVGTNAMHGADPLLEQRVRHVLTQLAAADRPPVVTGIAEVISVPGNLAGESETQIFLETDDGAPVSLSVLRRPGMRPSWGASWTELVDQSAQPPAPETLAWFSLACFLPLDLPRESFLQRDNESRARAREDYAHIRDELGPCARGG